MNLIWDKVEYVQNGSTVGFKHTLTNELGQKVYSKKSLNSAVGSFMKKYNLNTVPNVYTGYSRVEILQQEV